EVENSQHCFFYVVGLDFEPNRSCSSQRLARIRDISIEKRDIEVFSQANEIPLGISLHKLAPEDITIEFTNAVSISTRNENRRRVSKKDLGNGYSLPEGALARG